MVAEKYMEQFEKGNLTFLTIGKKGYDHLRKQKLKMLPERNRLFYELTFNKDELWWYIYGDPVKHPLEMGSYFGRWCLEAAVAAKVFAIDDRLCLGHEHYPGDFLRPDGPSTHPARDEAKPGLLGRLFGKR